MFCKDFKLYRTSLEFKSHCRFSTFPLWPSIHFFHQCFWSSHMLLSHLFPDVSLWCTVNFLVLFYDHLVSRPKKYHWGRDLSVYEYGRKANFFAYKGAYLICSLQRAEQNSLVLYSGLWREKSAVVHAWMSDLEKNSPLLHSSCAPNN